MTIRKIQSPYNYIKKVIVASIVILIIIGQLIHKNNRHIPINDNNNYIVAPDGIQIGKTIQAIGTIQSENNFPIYTHSIVLENKGKIGLRSTSTNLNNFSGTFTVQGTIHDIKKSIPSIDIERIRNDTSGYKVTNNIYTYFQKQLIINLENLASIHSVSDNKSVYILSDSIPIVRIEHINCKNKDKEKICNTYKKSKEDTTERFSSSLGHTFYKIQEGIRALFHENNNIYTIHSENDENIIDFSSTIELLDASYLLKNYETEIFDTCKELDTINQATAQSSGTDISLVVTGINTKKETMGCTISMDLRNDRGITNISLF